jgi:myosin-crossreactive antigen
MTKCERRNLESLSKEQLIKIISDWDHQHSHMSCVCVNESKWHIDAKEAIKKIREYLTNIYRYDLFDEHLGDYIDCELGKISGEEYRERVLGKDDE